MERLLIAIPSYNAKPFLRATVDRIPWDAFPADIAREVFFIDNASQDGTQDEICLIRQELESAGIPAQALLRSRNQGYGGSMKAALDAALEGGADYLAILHADGQYAPELLPPMLEQLRTRPEAALHFGSRLTGRPLAGGMPLYKYAANHLLSGLQNLLLGARLSEYHSGYRLYRMALMAGLPYRNLSDGFVFDNQIIWLILDRGFGVSESTIPTHYGEEKSHVPRIATPLAILGQLGLYLLHRWGIRRSRLYAEQESK